MKIKDKISGEVYEAETWKSWNGAIQYVKKGTSGPIRQSDEVEIIEEDKPKDTTDWSSFRREAAKDAMCQLIGMSRDDGYKYSPEQVASYAIVYADELIKQLKQK